MATIAADRWEMPRRPRDILLAGAGLLLCLIGTAFARHQGQPSAHLTLWMTLHLATIVPAVPVGAVMLWRRKGDPLHRAIGYLWCALMVAGALTSFGVRGLMGHLSPIHLLSILTLVTVPRAILAARAGRIAAHRRMMSVLYAALVIAGYFTFLPMRLLGSWLLG